MSSVPARRAIPSLRHLLRASAPVSKTSSQSQTPPTTRLITTTPRPAQTTTSSSAPRPAPSAAARPAPSASAPRPAQAFPSNSASKPASPPPSSTQSSSFPPTPSSSNDSSSPPPATARNDAANPSQPYSLTEGLSDEPPVLDPDTKQIDWTRSFHGLGAVPYSEEVSKILLDPVDVDDVEVKPDGILYLPEIKYRRILNKAFGPGSWGLAPRGETIVTGKLVTREYGLVVQGRLVSVARGEQQYFDTDGIPTATEGCKSNALMRCCKDLGIASELWDPKFLRKFNREYVREAWVEHVVNKRKRKISLRKDDQVRYPFKEVSAGMK